MDTFDVGFINTDNLTGMLEYNRVDKKLRRRKVYAFYPSLDWQQSPVIPQAVDFSDVESEFEHALRRLFSKTR